MWGEKYILEMLRYKKMQVRQQGAVRTEGMRVHPLPKGIQIHSCVVHKHQWAAFGP